jgi:hypothetical protein
VDLESYKAYIAADAPAPDTVNGENLGRSRWSRSSAATRTSAAMAARAVAWTSRRPRRQGEDPRAGALRRARLSENGIAGNAMRRRAIYMYVALTA